MALGERATPFALSTSHCMVQFGWMTPSTTPGIRAQTLGNGCQCNELMVKELQRVVHPGRHVSVECVQSVVYRGNETLQADVDFPFFLLVFRPG
jgi:hypothetical protein